MQFLLFVVNFCVFRRACHKGMKHT